MQTRSNLVEHLQSENAEGQWAARPAKSPSSVFGNFRPTPQTTEASAPGPEVMGRPAGGQPLQAAINVALARSAVYRFLAQAYEDPSRTSWDGLIHAGQMLQLAAGLLAPDAPGLANAAIAFAAGLRADEFETFLGSYLTVFGHAARGNCPLNEIEYGELKADPLIQPHRLADVAAFYRAFGLEVAAQADERQDHICLELEFMCVLAAKEAYALEHQMDLEHLSICRDAQKKFLREHLGRWTPAFGRRLARMAAGTSLGALGNLTRIFIETECVRLGVASGSEDLLLRPVDEAAESLCNSCGLSQSPPGAQAETGA